MQAISATRNRVEVDLRIHCFHSLISVIVTYMSIEPQQDAKKEEKVRQLYFRIWWSVPEHQAHKNINTSQDTSSNCCCQSISGVICITAYRKPILVSFHSNIIANFPSRRRKETLSPIKGVKIRQPGAHRRFLAKVTTKFFESVTGFKGLNATKRSKTYAPKLLS